MLRIPTAFLVTFFVCFSCRAQSGFAPYTQSVPGSPVAFDLVPIRGDTFIMGSPEREKGRSEDEGPVVTVVVSDFWMSTCETTYDLYEMFMYESKDPDPKPDAISRPSPPYIDFSRGMGKQGGYPANSMSQYAALSFCRWLYHKTGIFYRLPTEAEWEYACRAGTRTAYPNGKNAGKLAGIAWFAKNSGGHYHRIGQLQPNAWGLYDMLGNVAEWTLDEYREDYLAGLTPYTRDPQTKPTARHPRTLKGGSYADDAARVRPAARLRSNLDWNRRDPQLPRSKWWNTDAPFTGFRVVRPALDPNPQWIESFFQQYLGFEQ